MPRRGTCHARRARVGASSARLDRGARAGHPTWGQAIPKPHAAVSVAHCARCRLTRARAPPPAQIGDLISRAMERVGRQGVVTMEESRTAEDNLYVVEGMQFDRGYISPYFVTDPERMARASRPCAC